MSKILLLSTWAPPPDGVAFHSLALVNSWRRAGHEVLVVTAKVQGGARHTKRVALDGSGVRVTRILRLIPRRTTTFLLTDYQPDVVIVQFAIASQNTALLSTLRTMSIARRFGIPVVVAFHEPARELERLGPLSRWIYRAAALFTTYPVVYSPAGAAALVQAGIFTHVTEVPHGCESPMEPTKEDLARVRERYGVHFPLVLSLGFTHVDKGTDLLVKAMTEVTLLRDGAVQFLVAGSPRTRRGLFRLMGRADCKFHKSLTMESRQFTGVSVEFCGFVPDEDVGALFNLASVVVLPYRRATQSGIAQKALAARAVIVASDISELRNDLGLAARYFRSGSVSDLVETLVSVLRDPQNELRDAAATRAKERNYDVVSARLLDLGLSGGRPSQ